MRERPRPSAAPAATTVWLARHGEVHNPEQVLYGRLPRVRLSPEGHRQARALADFLAPRPLAAIYSSPMLRARKTAAVIAAAHPGLRVRIDRDLQEIQTAWQGEPLADLETIDWDFYANPRSPTDETLESICRRMRRWLGRVLRRHAGGEVVGVTHGDPVLILVNELLGRPLERAHIFPQPYIPTGCVYRLRFDPAGAFQDSELFVPHEAAAA